MFTERTNLKILKLEPDHRRASRITIKEIRLPKKVLYCPGIKDRLDWKKGHRKPRTLKSKSEFIHNYT